MHVNAKQVLVRHFRAAPSGTGSHSRLRRTSSPHALPRACRRTSRRLTQLPLQVVQGLLRHQPGCFPHPQAPQLFVGQSAGGEEKQSHFLDG
jgi:hypothetical protein